ncbi:MAG: hypothetical protein HLUCCA11_04155 [Phormidesmis priestleyi Ana]|uniref:Uncharacterized protein n=1 Tax=Phormidesmis priestleyi Ana TaxID=1666911 RepID=A0A0N8KNP6_9CYAN|nr:MAG: hypothetical protein HLUCCA11_04155 [Phormidesmis priestleyi Ana]
MLRLSNNRKTAVVIREQQKEEERIRDIEMLLESLFLREEVTFKLIADCLYDVGSVNLVNQKVHSRPLNWLLKAIARRSKPIFRFFMLRWGRKNAPQLIATWLHSQVVFEPSQVVLPEVMNPEENALEGSSNLTSL